MAGCKPVTYKRLGVHADQVPGMIVSERTFGFDHRRKGSKPALDTWKSNVGKDRKKTTEIVESVRGHDLQAI
jgi:hypothetical protein